jgi:hypothetical protein
VLLSCVCWGYGPNAVLEGYECTVAVVPCKFPPLGAREVGWGEERVARTDKSAGEVRQHLVHDC